MSLSKVEQAVKTATVKAVGTVKESAPKAQKAVKKAAKKAVTTVKKAAPKVEKAVKKVAKTIEIGFVAIDPKNGNILAMLGGQNFRNFRYGLNHVTQIRRQPGSAFKPFVYTVAIDNGYPPCYELLNQPVSIIMADGSRWTPSNSDGQFGGKVTIREGVAVVADGFWWQRWTRWRGWWRFGTSGSSEVLLQHTCITGF